MKKLLSLFLILLLCACSNNNEVVPDKTDNIRQYIEPAKEVEVFEYLNDETKDLLYKANNNSDVKTHLMELLGKDLLDYEATDYYGNKVNFKDYRDSKLIIELAANWCTHCMKQSNEYNDELLANHSDITLIQYFNDGSKDEVDAFYKKIDKSIPSNIIVIPEDTNLSNELLSRYNPEFYPAFLIFDHGVLTWISVSQLTSDELDLAYEVAFNNALDLNDLVDNNGKSIFSYTRTVTDVKNDLGEYNYNKLEEIDNDSYTTSNTLKYIGSSINYLDQLENESYFDSEVDFTKYLDKNTVIVYVSEIDDKQIQMINDYTDSHVELNVMVVDITDEHCDTYKERLTAPVVSIMNQIPNQMNEISFNSYPSAIFVEGEIVMGCYSHIENIEMFNKATELFMGENALAVIK